MGEVIHLHTGKVIVPEPEEVCALCDLPKSQCPHGSPPRRRPGRVREPVLVEDAADLVVLAEKLGQYETVTEQRPIITAIRRLVESWDDG